LLPACVGRLQGLRARGHEVILADGGSGDGTLEAAAGQVDHCVVSSPGRAVQMNAGAAVATGDVLWFLHVDTHPPDGVDGLIETALGDPGRVWGRFDVRLSGSSPTLRVVERMMNWRSRWTGVATGDQALFVRREAFVQLGGYPAMPLMEDVALSTRLKRLARPVCVPQRVTTSSRRWEINGVWQTIGLMWFLRLAYALGADPQWLADRYYPSRRRAAA